MKRKQGIVFPGVRFWRFVLMGALFFTSHGKTVAQARLIMNGAKINIAGGAFLVIENSAATAITRLDGYIISEGEGNIIKWSIGTSTGTYTIPWGYGNANYLPLSFTNTAGSGSGFFLFSTYHTNWQNSTQLPTGVTHISGASGSDNSAFSADRFWRIEARNYTTKPSFSNLTFTYLDLEHEAASNTITESGLKAKRFNSDANSWTDKLLSSTTDVSGNTVTASTVDASDVYAWWALGTLGANRYWVAPSASNANLSANWSETAGGTGNAGVPTYVDAVIFDGTSDADCVLDSDLTVASLNVSSGFTGTITHGGNAMNISSTATFSGGTFLGGTSGISVGGDFTLSGTTFSSTSGVLDLKKNFTLTSGSFAHNNGTVRFSGTTGATQNITSAAVVNFNNISATNAAANPGVSVESNQNLRGVLTLAGNVIFDPDGSSNTAIFTLVSSGDNPTSDAAIAALPTGARISGNVTVQRHMSKEGPNGGRIYRYISSPVQNATVSDIQKEIPVTGSFTGASTCSGCGTLPSLFFYREAVITDTNGNGIADLQDGYIKFPNTTNTETFEAGRGYALYVRGNILPSTLWDLRGAVNTGNETPVTLPVTFTTSGSVANDGWNLVGNPFPSTIDWNAAQGWTKSNLEDAIYTTDNGSASAGQFATWNGVTGTNGGSRYIATGQGFWVKANGTAAPVLQAGENVKVAGTQTTFFRERQVENLIRITLVKGATRDETVVHFREDASPDFDAHADARKMFNATFNLSSLLPNGKEMAINSMSALHCGSSVRLKLGNVTTGNYRLNFSEYESFPDFVTLTLRDNYLQSKHDVRNGGYDFSVTADNASQGAGRFELDFSLAPIDFGLSLAASAVCEGTDAIIRIQSVQPGLAYGALVNGILVGATEKNGETTVVVPHKSLLTGINNITVRAYYENCSTFAENNIGLEVKQKYNPSVQGAKHCGEGTITLAASGAPEDGHYNWYPTALSAYPDAGQHTSTFTTPVLQKSKTYYVSIVNSLGCEGERMPVKADIEYPDAPVSAFSVKHCGKGQVELTVPNAEQYDVINWYVDRAATTIVNTGPTFVTPELQTAETYYVATVNSSGCESLRTPVVADVIVYDEAVITLNGEYLRSNHQQGNQWYVNGEKIEGATDTYLKPEQKGRYTLEVTVRGCLTTSDAYEALIIGIEGPEDHKIWVSPNPVRDEALIEISDSFKDIKEVCIINILGKMMGCVELFQRDNKKIGKLQMSSFSSGIYIVRVAGANRTYEIKVVKE